MFWVLSLPIAWMDFMGREKLDKNAINEALAGLQGQAHYARITLDSALRDSDPRVQQRAQELLQELSGPESGAAQ